MVLNHPDRREDGRHSKANCTSRGFQPHSTGWEGSIWGIPVESPQTYGFTNVRDTACPLNANPLTDRSPVSLVCGPESSGYPKTYAPGANQRYLFADDKHPSSNDNTVRYKRLALQIPAGRHRRHYVKARVRVHEYPDGTMAVFHGPRCLARYHADGQPIDSQTREAA